MAGAAGAVTSPMSADANADDVRMMNEALALADDAAAAGEVPIGAVVVVAGQIIGRGMNRVIRDGDTTAHAEIVALRDCFRRVNNYRIPGATLYTTVEPCAMCYRRPVARARQPAWSGERRPKFGAAGSVTDLFANHRLNHHARQSDWRCLR